MIFLKITGIILGAIALLIATILLTPVKFQISSKSGKEIKFRLFLGIFRINTKKNKQTQPKNIEKSQSKKKKVLSDKTKKLFGIDKFENIKTLKYNLKESGFKGTFGKSIEITKFLMKQLGKLISKVKLEKLHIQYVCVGEDAADTAVKYGMLSAFVYPFVALLESSMNSQKNKLSVILNCDFDKKEADYEFICAVKLRIIYALIVFIKTVVFLTKENQWDEEK